MVALWGSDLIQIYNDGYRALMGDKHPGGLGRPTREVWPEVWHINEPILRRALAGETVMFEDALYPVARHGLTENAWFTLSYSPLREEEGGVAGVLVTVFETTDRVRAVAATRQSEERLRVLLTASSYVVYRMNADWTEMRLLDGRGFVTDTKLPTEAWLGDYIYPEDHAEVMAAVREAIRTNGVFDLEHRVRRVDGSVGWTHSRAVPLLDENGELADWFGLASDVTARRKAEAARQEDQLHATEERFRVIAENARNYAVLITDPEGRITDWLPGAQAVFGWTREEAIGQPSTITFTPEDRALNVPERQIRRAHDHGRAGDVRWHRRADGGRVFIEGTVTALHDTEGGIRGYLKIGQDVTERREAENRQRLLLFELQHRVRNILAVVRSIARRTGDTSTTVAQYRAHLDGRIAALARTQALLTRRTGAGVDLQTLVRDELVAQAAQPYQTTCGGPDVVLAPKAAEILTLAIHELATNSTKYGALADPAGRVEVGWTLEDRGALPWLSFDWEEHGVAVDATPKCSGFGTELITRRAPYELQGHGTIAVRPTGAVINIEFPIVPGESILQTGADGLVGGGRY